MNLYWLVELDETGSAMRTVAVIAEDGERRSFRLLEPPSPPARAVTADASPPAGTSMPVDLDVVVSWSGHRLGLLPVASPPLTDDLEEAVEYLAGRVAATMRAVS